MAYNFTKVATPADRRPKRKKLDYGPHGLIPAQIKRLEDAGTKFIK
jgi:hypothetical protein